MLMLPAAGLWMRVAAWWNVPGEGTGQVAAVTCVITPVPRAWRRDLPTVRAVTPVSTVGALTVSECDLVW